MKKRYLAFAGTSYESNSLPSDEFVGAFRYRAFAVEAADRALKEIVDSFAWCEVFDIKEERQVHFRFR